jgi:hypothetical protein
MKIQTTIVLCSIFTLSEILVGCSAFKKNESRFSEDKFSETVQGLSTLKPGAEYLAGQILAGYTSGEQDTCRWFLQLENDSTRLLDPINLSEDFQKADLQVWIYFSGMRRMNRCPEANPVWIQDIVLRKR